jgi:hypothetical protein
MWDRDEEEELNRRKEFDALLATHGFAPPRIPDMVGRGWWPILDELLGKLKALGLIEIAQIKEKFGLLRFYQEAWAEGTSDEAKEQAYKLIDAAEAASGKVCEDCGAPGSLGTPTGHWIRTVCPACAEAMKAAHAASLAKSAAREREIQEVLTAAEATLKGWEDGLLTEGEALWGVVQHLTTASQVQGLRWKLRGPLQMAYRAFVDTVDLEAEWHFVSSTGAGRLPDKAREAIGAWRATRK